MRASSQSPAPIGYYVHHQGRGHLTRAEAIRARLSRRCVLIGSFANGEMKGPALSLQDDRASSAFAGLDGENSRPEAFHYAPVGVASVRERMAVLAAWIATEKPACLVVDVSCEVALFGRLLSVPVMLVRLAGRRNDTPHLEAFRSAERLVAPFAPALEDEATPAWVRDKTDYCGFIAGLRPHLLVAEKQRRVALVLGQGGMRVTGAMVEEAARATPAWEWEVFGDNQSGGRSMDNLHFNGWCDDLAGRLAESAIVVGACGDGLLADVVAAGKRFICIPEDRPFDEQRSKARYLAREKMAVVLDSWPGPDRWERLLGEASGIDPARIASLYDPAAVGKCVAVIEAVAARAR